MPNPPRRARLRIAADIAADRPVVDDLYAWIAQRREHIGGRSDERRIEPRGQAGLPAPRRLIRDRQAGGKPLSQPAVQHTDLVVPEGAESPPDTSRRAGA